MLAWFAAAALASERMGRDVTELPAASVRALAQGPDARVWAGTYNGLWVLDGVSARRVAADRLPGLVDELAIDATGRVWARHEDGRLVEVTDVPGAVATDSEAVATDAGDVATLTTDGSAREVRPDTVRGWDDVTSVATDASGRLAVLRGAGPSTVMLRDAGGWQPAAELPDSGELLSLGSTIYVARDGELDRLGAHGVEKVADVRRAVGVAEWPGAPGALAVATWYGELFRVEGGVATLVYDDPGRGISLVRRGDTLWFSADRTLVALREGHLEQLGPREGVAGGGPLLVATDGSMWLGDFLGAHVFPEPDTRTFADADGLPSAHARYVVNTGHREWVATWQGIGAVDDRGATVAGPLPYQVEGGWCVDGGAAGAGRETDGAGGASAWAGVLDMVDAAGQHFGLVRVDDTGATLLADAVTGWPRGCAALPDAMWFTTTDGLWRVDRATNEATLVQAGRRWNGVAAAADGHLWVASREELLEVNAGEVLRTIPLKLASRVTALRRVGAAWWIATEGDGLWRVDEAGPSRVHLAGEPTPLHLLGLTPTADGVWIAGQGTLARVSTDPEPRVLETIGAWHGLAVDGAEQVDVRADGGLWLASSWGLVDVPASARVRPGAAPAPIPAGMPEGRGLVVGAGSLSISAPPNDLLLAYALPAWREPTLGRLRAEVDGTVRSLEGGVLRFVDLAPGEHHVVVESSLDGVSWTPGPATWVAVPTPWYRTPPALLAAAAALAALLGAAYRLRVAALLRVERERSRIALDLHDEIGSGLAGIAALLGLAADPETDDATRRTLTTQVAGSAEELGAAMGDIVWSLRRDSRDPAALLALLAERGNRLLAPHDGQVVVDAPAAWPTALSLPVRRALQRIGLEALHNAARHGRARRVELSLRPGARWTFSVTDDGAPPEAATAGSGLGLDGMRARAAAIGATIATGPRPEGGFAVIVRFDPHATGTPRGPAWLQRLLP